MARERAARASLASDDGYDYDYETTPADEYSYYSYSYSSVDPRGRGPSRRSPQVVAPAAAPLRATETMRRAPTLRRAPTFVSPGSTPAADGWNATPVRLDSFAGARLNSTLSTGEKVSLDLGPHQLPLNDLGRLLQVDLPARDPSRSPGLSTDEAALRLREGGRNVIPPPDVVPEWRKYLNCYIDMFVALLVACGVLCLVIYGIDRSTQINLWLGLLLLLVVVVTSTITYFQSRSSANVMAELAGLVPEKATVRRGGQENEIDPAELVVGDVFRIKAGDRVPADARVLWSNDCKVDNSSLNGESEPVTRVPDVSKSDDPLQATNMVFSSTLTVNGDAICVAVATGKSSQMAQIAGLAAADKGIRAPLEIEVDRFVRIIAGISIVLCVVFVILGIFVISQKITAAIVTALGLLVANCPQGLPATVSLSLGSAAKRLRKANVVVKSLPQVETLGSVSVIASDKTGTLTQNRMTCSNMWIPRTVDPDPSDPVSPLRGADALNVPPQGAALMRDTPAGNRLARCAAMCSRAQFAGAQMHGDAAAIEGATLLGDATEQGLLRFSAKLFDVATTRAALEKIYEIPFNSLNKFQLSIHTGMARAYPNGDGVDRVILFKGAPEVVLAKCSHYYVESPRAKGGLVAEPIDDAFRARFAKVYARLGAMGERVLGFAELPLPRGHRSADLPAEVLSLEDGSVPLEGYVFCGLISLIDPPKATVPASVALCRRAGIRVIMMTGDHPSTAEAIAKQVGIITSKTREEIAEERGVDPSQVPEADVHAVVVHGQTLPTLTLEEWDRVLSKPEVVFARMSPIHKTLIVENCQRRGDIVAVTGDGVNDSPSLKKANVGVAMGIAGTSVSKDAADIILLDDDFSSIVLGIEVGRVIFDNLKKAIVYILVHLATEMWPVLLNILVGTPQMISTVAVLIIDLCTEIIPGLALSYETGESNVMSRPPRNPKTEHLISMSALALAYLQLGSIQALGSIFAFFVSAYSNGIHPHQAYFGWNDPVWTEDILFEAQSVYFFSLVLQQCFCLYALRTRVGTILLHPPLSNKVVYLGWVWSLGVAAFVIYVPGLNTALNMRPVPPLHLLLGIPGGFCIILWAEIVKAGFRCRCVPLKWLQY